MKKIVLRIIPIIFLFQASLAQAIIEAEPYIGVDLQVRQMRFKRNFGSNLFNKNLVQVNPYVGLMFCENIGLELGYEHGFHKNANSVQTRGDIVLGRPLVSPVPGLDIESEDSTNSVEIHGPNLNIVGTLPICPDFGTSLIAGIGVARLHTKVVYQPTRINDLELNAEALAFLKQRFKKTKSVLRLTAGVQQMVTDCAGVRATLVWENTSRFKNIIGNQPTSRASFKDSLNYGIGVFWKF